MAWTVEDSGTQSATIDTEHTLETVTSGADTYLFVVDLENLANGDEVTLRIKTTVLSAGNQNTVYEAVFSNAQGDVSIAASIPVVGTGQDVVFTLEQTNGTGRDFDWAVLSQ